MLRGIPGGIRPGDFPFIARLRPSRSARHQPLAGLKIRTG